MISTKIGNFFGNWLKVPGSVRGLLSLRFWSRYDNVMGYLSSTSYRVNKSDDLRSLLVSAKMGPNAGGADRARRSVLMTNGPEVDIPFSRRRRGIRLSRRCLRE